MTYAQKLKDQRWQKKRLSLLDSAGWKCQNPECKTKEPNPTLSVHHSVYLRNTQPWDYEDWAYSVLCESCHEKEQLLMEGAHKAIAKSRALMMACATLDLIPREVAADFSYGLLPLVQKDPSLIPHIAECIHRISRLCDDCISVGCEIGTPEPDK